MRSNVTVGPPIDLLAYGADELEITRRRRFPAGDSDLVKIGVRWEQALRQAVGRLPQIRFRAQRTGEETIQLVEPPVPADPAAELPSQVSQPPS
jgi:predicted proteasome-type protease